MNVGQSWLFPLPGLAQLIPIDVSVCAVNSEFDNGSTQVLLYLEFVPCPDPIKPDRWAKVPIDAQPRTVLDELNQDQRTDLGPFFWVLTYFTERDEWL